MKVVEKQVNKRIHFSCKPILLKKKKMLIATVLDGFLIVLSIDSFIQMPEIIRLEFFPVALPGLFNFLLFLLVSQIPFWESSLIARDDLT